MHAPCGWKLGNTHIHCTHTVSHTHTRMHIHTHTYTHTHTGTLIPRLLVANINLLLLLFTVNICLPVCHHTVRKYMYEFISPAECGRTLVHQQKRQSPCLPAVQPAPTAPHHHHQGCLGGRRKMIEGPQHAIKTRQSTFTRSKLSKLSRVQH